MRGTVLALCLALPGSASAYTLTIGSGPAGERPSRFEPVDFPASRFAERPKASEARLTAGPSSFVLKGVASQERAKTESMLTALGARQDGDRILVNLPSDVLFDFDKSEIRADARPVLSQLAGVLLAMPKAPVGVVGHTDAMGSDAYNLALSERRALSVRDWLRRLGVSARRMTTAGKGESAPVAANRRADGSDDPDGRQKNRRVEFIIGTGD